jgi:hypothetical protein
VLPTSHGALPVRASRKCPIEASLVQARRAITVWLEVRVLPGPPRSPMRNAVSRSLTKSPQFAGIFAGSDTGHAVSAAR